MKKYLALGIAMAMLTVGNADAALAAGWDYRGGEWQYLNNDGTAVADQWKSSDGLWYFLGSDGKMVRGQLIESGDNLYFVDDQGRRITNQWVSVEAGENEYGLDRFWYYFGQDGKAYRKKNAAFKRKIDGKTYAFDEDGIMLSGYLNADGGVLTDGNIFADAEYCFGPEGAMLTEQWQLYEGIEAYDEESLLGGRPYGEFGEMWMYFDENGKKVRSRKGEKPQNISINGVGYGFDENGIMLTWWGENAASSSNAAAPYYSGYDGGQLLKNTWLWMYPSEALAESAETKKEDYQQEEYSWWRTDSKGKVIRNKIKEINGKEYAFDDIGRMQTGFVLFDGKTTYVAQWDVDAWSSDDFIDADSPLRYLGFEVSDLYLFGPNELNDGSMQIGNEIKVELADGVHTFGFGSNGKAIGSRCRLVKRNDSFYFNGLRLEAEPGLRYGVVRETNGKYRVIDENGKIIKGKRVVQDGDGGWYVIVNDEFKAYVGNEDKPRWHKKNGVEGYYYYDRTETEKYGPFIANKDTASDITHLPAEAKLYGIP